MKRFFISAVVSMACFMAHAQSITIPKVNISPGCEKKVDVSIPSGTDYTAFQFDIALPEGISVTGATLNGAPDTRKITSGMVGGKFRVLSYDEKNTKFTNADAILSLTFAAEGNVTTGQKNASVADVVLVEPEGETPQTTGGDVAINVGTSVTLEFVAAGKLAIVSDFDLDFSSLTDVKAYIAIGYDLTTNALYLMRVKDVPAGTPIWVVGPANSTKEIPVGTPKTYYPQSFLAGSATQDITIPASNDEFINMTLSPKTGKINGVLEDFTDFPAGKAYLHIPKNVTSTVGSSVSLNLNAKGNKLAYVSPCDLDFTDVQGLKAYIITGYDKDGTILMVGVKKVSANTPLYLKGEEANYTVPSAAAQLVYVNMLKGNANTTSAFKAVDGLFTTWILSKGTGLWGPAGEDWDDFPAGKSYLPVPTAYIPSQSRSHIVGGVSEEEPEVICVKLGMEGDGDTTGIREIKNDGADDVWYNLKGQRIDTPTKKGLYIKNGAKVVVK